jgi:hypothetical protein
MRCAEISPIECGEKQCPQHDDARVSSQDEKNPGCATISGIVPIVDVDSIDLVFAIIEESAML